MLCHYHSDISTYHRACDASLWTELWHRSDTDLTPGDAGSCDRHGWILLRAISNRGMGILPPSC